MYVVSVTVFCLNSTNLLLFTECPLTLAMPSLPEAVDQKYGDGYAAVTEVSCIALQLRRCGGRQRLPSVLILADCEIEEAGEDTEVEKRCEGVRELDISKNKLRQWDEVGGGI